MQYMENSDTKNIYIIVNLKFKLSCAPLFYLSTVQFECMYVCILCVCGICVKVVDMTRHTVALTGRWTVCFGGGSSEGCQALGTLWAKEESKLGLPIPSL